MTTFQKVIKYFAIAFAVCLTICIIGGIMSLFGLFGGFFNDDAVTKDLKVYEVSSDIKDLTIEINAAELTIKQGESFSVKSNLKYLSVKDNDGTLTIKETKKFGVTYTGASLTLIIPTGSVFEKASITTGAGRVCVDCLYAGSMSLNFGAGAVEIDTLVATSDIEIDGGAGRITVSNGELHDLDLDMGVGQLDMKAALAGKSKLDLGVGGSNITVVGDKDDYSLDIEKGLGNITLDGTNVSSIKEQSNGSNSLRINGGIGNIIIEFKGSSAE